MQFLKKNDNNLCMFDVPVEPKPVIILEEPMVDQPTELIIGIPLRRY